MLKYIGYIVYLSSCLLLHISFTALYRFHLFSLNVLFAFKTLQGNLGNLTTVKYILFLPRSPCFPLSGGGYENEGLGGVGESEIGNRLASVGDESSPKLTPTLFASTICPK